MQKKLKTFHKSTEIVNSALPFIFLIFMIEVIPTSSSLKFIGVPLFVLCTVAKMFAISGTFGSLVELISYEKIVLTFKDFKQNAPKYWLLYFLLTLVPVTIHVALSLLGWGEALNITNLTAILSPALLAIFAYTVVRIKYLKPLGLKQRKLKIPPVDFLLLTAIFLTKSFLVNVYVVFPNIHNFYINLASFGNVYLNVLFFGYIAVLIMSNFPEIEKEFESQPELYMVNPLGGGVIEGIGSIFMRLYPPVFVILKALTPKNYKPRVFNRVAWRKRYFRPNRLVAITCFTSNSAEAYKIAKEFRKQGSKVVMGGPHVTYQPEEALEFCDSVVIGECESVWKNVVRDFEKGTLKNKYIGIPLDDFHSEVHQELLSSPPEIIKDFIETTRGCKFRCHFCTIPSLSGGKTRKKPIPEIVELINKIKHKYHVINFIDNNIYSDPAYAKDLFKALKPLGIKWTTQCTIDIAKNKETLRLAKESGCTAFLFGYEIFGGSLEDKQGGKFALADQYIRFTNIIKDMGIKIKGHFIFGFDTDTFRNSIELWKFCFRVRPMFTIISLLTPLPGSRLYHDMLRENRLTNLNWRNYACHDLVFRHQRMNNYWLKKLYPAYLYLFFFTTSTAGFIMGGMFLSWVLFITLNKNLPFT